MDHHNRMDKSLESLESMDWNRTGGVVRDFDDGHVPENLIDVDSDNGDDEDNGSGTIRRRRCPTRIVDYPLLFSRTPAQVHVYADAFPERLVDELYQRTVEDKHTSWGDYVTMEQVHDYWNEKEADDNDHRGKDDSEHETLLVQAVAQYLKLALGEDNGVNRSRTTYGSNDSATSRLWTRHDLNLAHGVAVWALRAQVGSHVSYHLDYAEQVRYQTNLIVPPLLAGTLQCTRDELQGGAFKVSLEGIEHYRRHGYKEKKRKIDDSIEDGKTEMIEIPYRYNQLTCHLGNLPHLSTKVNAINGKQDRVIVGFNVFCRCVGPVVQLAPEHSANFRRLIQVEKYVNRTTTMGKLALDMESLKRNRPLAKLLVLAKRDRIKKEFRLSNQRLEQEVPQKLPATVQQLIHFFSGGDGVGESKNGEGWVANPVDIRVFLHHQVRDGKLRVSNQGDFDDSLDGLLSPMAKLTAA